MCHELTISLPSSGHGFVTVTSWCHTATTHSSAHSLGAFVETTRNSLSPTTPSLLLHPLDPQYSFPPYSCFYCFSFRSGTPLQLIFSEHTSPEPYFGAICLCPCFNLGFHPLMPQSLIWISDRDCLDRHLGLRLLFLHDTLSLSHFSLDLSPLTHFS